MNAVSHFRREHNFLKTTTTATTKNSWSFNSDGPTELFVLFVSLYAFVTDLSWCLLGTCSDHWLTEERSTHHRGCERMHYGLEAICYSGNIFKVFAERWFWECLKGSYFFCPVFEQTVVRDSFLISGVDVYWGSKGRFLFFFLQFLQEMVHAMNFHRFAHRSLTV